MRTQRLLFALALALSAPLLLRGQEGTSQSKPGDETTASPPADEAQKAEAKGDESRPGDTATEQAPEEAGTEEAPEATKAAAPAQAGKEPPKDQEKLAPGEVRVRAETQEVVEKGHFQARGNVDLRTGDMRVQADQVDVYEIEKPDGSKGRKAIAVGNVVFIREDERLAGDRATMDLDAGTGVFENAQGYVQPGMMVVARTIERLDAGTYRVEGGTFTACMQPDPRWDFTSSSAKVKVNDKVLAKNAVFKVKNVPAFYFPYLVYPINDSQRSTGFLIPHVGTSSLRGFDIGEGFFWAMGRSADQTFYADHYSKAGYGLGHDLRWALEGASRGDLKTYAFSPRDSNGWDYDIDWNALQILPGRARLSLFVRRYSTTLFQSRYQDNFNLATSRTERALFNFQKSFPFANLQVSAEDNRTFFSDQTRVNRRVPSLRLNRQPRKIGKTPLVFSFDARAEQLGWGNEVKIDDYSRFDVTPELSIPLSTTFLQINPRARVRYTRYGASLVETEAVGPPLDRRYFEGSINIVGPTFSRVYNTPDGAYTDKFKHVIGPEITWSYRTAVDDFNSIPKFDGIDQMLGTNQVDYGIVQRLYARRPGAGGKLSPWEFLSWTLYQTYYVQIAEGQNSFDPNYSSNVFGPGGVPDHNSPIRSRIRVRPTAGLQGTMDVEYDVNFNQIRNVSLGGGVTGERGTFTANWNRARRVAEDPAQRSTIRNFVRGAGSFQVLPHRLTADGSVNYDVLNSIMLQSTARLRWEVQCCGFSVEVIQFNYNGRDERQLRFSVELANVGSMGNFMGDAHPGQPGYGAGGLR